MDEGVTFSDVGYTFFTTDRAGYLWKLSTHGAPCTDSPTDTQRQREKQKHTCTHTHTPLPLWEGTSAHSVSCIGERRMAWAERTGPLCVCAWFMYMFTSVFEPPCAMCTAATLECPRVYVYVRV
jgi:hypothetical protein